MVCQELATELTFNFQDPNRAGGKLALIAVAKAVSFV
jgi:hypothetical protein